SGNDSPSIPCLLEEPLWHREAALDEKEQYPPQYAWDLGQSLQIEAVRVVGEVGRDDAAQPRRKWVRWVQRPFHQGCGGIGCGAVLTGKRHRQHRQGAPEELGA